MPVETQTLEPIAVAAPKRALTQLLSYFARIFEPLGQPVPWNRTTYLGLLSLVVLWAIRFYTTWATWGDLSIDSGHEMYVPVALLQGKMLYRDIWYMHGPLAPYFNRELFRVFGIHLNVLYWAGSLTGLACAIVLYVIGMELSSWVAGWTVAAVVLIQAFHPFIFNYALPYSFDTAYGSLAAGLFLWFGIRGLRDPRWGWTFAAATAAAAALLCKIEIGTACYIGLALLILMRILVYRSWKSTTIDLLTLLPGALVVAGLVHWMIGIKDLTFITDENIVSFPGTYYMKTYGQKWLEASGFALNLANFRAAFVRTAVVATASIPFYRLLHRLSPRARSAFWGLGALVAGLALTAYLQSWQAEVIFRWIFFPQDIVSYVSLASLTGCWYFWRQPSSERACMAFLLIFSPFLAFRILFGMKPSGYPIFYNGPVLLAFLLLAIAFLPRSGRTPDFIFRAESLICFGCLAAVILHTVDVLPSIRDYVPLVTDRGTIRIPKRQTPGYEAAIEFMKEKGARGEAVLSLPEDTSLYFLSGTDCPIRVWLFGPGLMVPGRMTNEFFAEMDSKPVKYLLWSPRTFAETGSPNFGIDFDIPIGYYLQTHYKFVRPLVPLERAGGWNAGIWERKP